MQTETDVYADTFVLPEEMNGIYLREEVPEKNTCSESNEQRYAKVRDFSKVRAKKEKFYGALKSSRRGRKHIEGVDWDQRPYNFRPDSSEPFYPPRAARCPIPATETLPIIPEKRDCGCGCTCGKKETMQSSSQKKDWNQIILIMILFIILTILVAIIVSTTVISNNLRQLNFRTKLVRSVSDLQPSQAL